MQLVIEHLYKTYPNGVAALRDVSLSIPPGMFGLLGPNGAGKSTLMRILATLQEADAGRARLGDVDVLRDKDAVRRTLGYLPQEFGLYPKATAEEMLDHFALLKGVTDRRERKETVAALLQQTNLHGARRRKLGSFSGGMRQRFGIAVALIGSPRLIIVDEPTAGLDPAERVRFLNLLSELGENAVVILSTHIVEDVSDLCTRMAIIESGRILLEAEPQRAVEALRGRIWSRQVDRDELARLEQAVPVISTTLVAGRTVIHVHGDAPPDPSFEPVEPDLKDVYFTAIRGIRVHLHRPHPSAPVDEPDAIEMVAPADSVDSIHVVTAGDSVESAGPIDSTAPRGSVDSAAPIDSIDGRQSTNSIDIVGTGGSVGSTGPIDSTAPRGSGDPVAPADSGDGHRSVDAIDHAIAGDSVESIASIDRADAGGSTDARGEDRPPPARENAARDAGAE